jgi:hypothetical protein
MKTSAKADVTGVWVLTEIIKWNGYKIYNIYTHARSNSKNTNVHTFVKEIKQKWQISTLNLYETWFSGEKLDV